MKNKFLLSLSLIVFGVSSIEIQSSECPTYFSPWWAEIYLEDTNWDDQEFSYESSNYKEKAKQCSERFSSLDSKKIDDYVVHAISKLNKHWLVPDEVVFNEVLPLLNIILSAALEGNKTAEVFYISFEPDFYVADDFIAGNLLYDYFEEAKAKIYKNLSKSRQLLIDLDISKINEISSLENFYEQDQSLSEIDFYKLTTKQEKKTYLEYAMTLVEFNNSKLEQYTKYFLYHFDESETKNINVFELGLYTNFLFHLINSDHKKYINLLRKKLKNRLGIPSNLKLSMAIRRLNKWAYASAHNYIDTLSLNFSSYEFIQWPYDDLLFTQREDRIQWMRAASPTLGGYYLESSNNANHFMYTGMHNWLSDTAIQLHNRNIGDDCMRALSYWDEYIQLLNTQDYFLKSYLFLDFYTEMTMAANCAIKAYDANPEGLQLAKSYIELARENKNFYSDKFEELYFDMVNLKILYYDGNEKNTFTELIELKNRIFSKEFLTQNFQQTEYFDRSITIYSLLYSYYNQSPSFNVDELAHPIEFLDVKQAFIKNNSLTELNLASNDSINKNLQNELQKINLEIAIYEQNFISEGSVNNFDQLQSKYEIKQTLINRLFSVNQNLKDFVSYQKTHFNEFRKNLESNSFILSIHFGQQESFGYLVSKDSSKIVYIPFTKNEASRSFSSFNKEIQENDISELSKSSTILYRRFFEGLLKDVPQGASIFLYGDEFNHIPMNALSIRYKENESDYERMLGTEWLIKKYKFSHLEPYYSYSSAKIKYQEEFLGIANPQLMKPLNLPALPSAEQEVLRLGLTVGATKDNFLVKENATFKNLVSKSKKSYKNIVFATHAITRDDVTNSPGLVISKEDDNFLSVLDILNLGLSADLVVLSACYPLNRDGALFGNGDNPTLPRAFLISGSNSVVSSNWEVETLSAAKITQKFYESMWQNPGQNKYEALRDANLEVLYDYSAPSNIHPKNWANLKITYKDHYSL
jgi:CHAT domain-containing protein